MKAVIMAGGQGTRFWPLSREQHPKQFLRLLNGRSMFQGTVERLQARLDISDIYVVCGVPYVQQVREQVPELGEEQILVEPAARNTAPCVGFAAIILQQQFPDEAMLVLPSDHVIRDNEEFLDVLGEAERLALDGWLVTFGIRPTSPSTGYGYVCQGEEIPGSERIPAYRVKRFTEKPDLETAEQFMKEGTYLWNSGMFVWSVQTILEEISQHMPRLSAGLKEIGSNLGNPDRVAEIFSAFEKESIDYGVMERAAKVATIPCRLGWSDVGNWQALAEVIEAQEERIVSNTEFEAIESSDCIIYSAGNKHVSLLGVSNLVVVETPDALMVCSVERTQDVKSLVQKLKKSGRGHLL